MALVGVITFAYKTLVMNFPIMPDEVEELWRIDVRVGVKASGDPVIVTLQIPKNERTHTVVDQTFVAQGYGLTTIPRGANMQAVFSIRKSEGEQALYYRAVLLRQKTERNPPKSKPQFARLSLKGLELEAASSLSRTLLSQSANEESLVSLILQRLRSPEPGRELALLLGESPTTEKKVRVAVALLTLARVPARSVHGVELRPISRSAEIQHWLEVYQNGLWQPYNPIDGRNVVPENSIPWWRGPVALANVQGAERTALDVSVSRVYEVALTAALKDARVFDSALVSFSVFALPIQTRAVYQILLVVPVGILLLVIFRNIIGIKTFGTFMPVLVAMAFRETGLLWGLALFAGVLAAGLGVRFYLDRLKLLLVPRIASIVIVVILLMAFFSVLSFKLGFERGLSVALFPIVILAMTIERMSIVWDERGPGEALQQAGGSFLVAVLCHWIMNVTLVQHLLFVFPELLLLVLASTLLIGRYSGYRLVELRRFKVLADGF